MNCKLITVCSDAGLVKPLINSAKKHGWDIRPIFTGWRGFGTKLLETRQYLIGHPEITHFFFCDAYDVIVVGSMEEALSKLDTSVMACSAERGCWPNGEYEKFYEPIFGHGFNYLNSGCYFAPREVFLKLFDSDMPDYATDDQLYLTEHFLFNEQSGIVLDYGQKVFNSHSFIRDGEYTYENGRVQILGEQSVFIHKNGRTLDEKLDELI